MTLEHRAQERRRLMTTHVAGSHDEAEDWDLDFWLARTPQERLSALRAILRDVAKVRAARPAGAPDDLEDED